ncbi:B3 domain-containing transcription factor ABI3-like [Durio zibethinus]|uniref:B3 domain-containing transcription factor ABI3-like n=1 Tax=Durio zibethinus TaxID=66656 RepID=A0A6P6A4Z3_DURZI|nr:B3 domain-containing transcription factor ABI3-like [Durio zibethinus]
MGALTFRGFAHVGVFKNGLFIITRSSRLASRIIESDAFSCFALLRFRYPKRALFHSFASLIRYNLSLHLSVHRKLSPFNYLFSLSLSISSTQKGEKREIVSEMKSKQQQLRGEDLHAGDRNEANPSEFDAVEMERGMGTEEREIWLDHEQQDDFLDVNDASIFYGDFPPLPDFPCMSSSSSSSSTRAPVKAIACSSASTASSSSSAASWAVLKSNADEDVERKNNGYCHQHQHRHHNHNQHDLVDGTPAALSSTTSMEILQPPDHNVMDGGVDCMDVMENFGCMDLLDNNDFFDPSSIFHHDDTGLEEFQKEQRPQQEQSQQLEQEAQMIYSKTEDQTQEEKASDDLAMVFLEWLKTNKETVSAEDLRRVKIKKATIECAARCLGGGKEAMKQLLKLILEWVQTNHLQKRRIKESPSSNKLDLPYQYHDRFQNPNPIPNPTSNPNLNCNSLPPSESNSCFSQPLWMPQAGYVTEPAAAVVPGFAPMVGYMGDLFVNGAPNINSHPYQPPIDYQRLESAQTWPASQFAFASRYNSFPDSNLHPAPPQPSVFPVYGNQYQYQYVHGHNNDQRLVRLGSSVTKEARKKRMARQKRFASHHRNQIHHSNQQSQHQNQSLDQHARLVNDNCVVAAQANPGNWVYWPSVAGGVASNPQVLPSEVAMVHPVDRPVMQEQTYQRQVASDRRQGWKPEKNLRFLLQKVLKQSDVGNLGRIVLPKKEAETHLPELEARDGISIAMEDIGTSRVWNMRYRFWPNNKSRMYLLENTGDFVRTNGLQEGDFIVIYSDVKCGKYLIRGVRVRQSGPKWETKRPAKSQKNQLANSPAAAINGSSSSPITQTIKIVICPATLVSRQNASVGIPTAETIKEFWATLR